MAGRANGTYHEVGRYGRRGENASRTGESTIWGDRNVGAISEGPRDPLHQQGQVASCVRPDLTVWRPPAMLGKSPEFIRRSTDVLDELIPAMPVDDGMVVLIARVRRCIIEAAAEEGATYETLLAAASAEITTITKEKTEAQVSSPPSERCSAQDRGPHRSSGAMPNNKKWAAEDDRRLLELKAAGKADAVIGHTMGRSTGSIAARLARLHTRTARLERLLNRLGRTQPIS
jgi:hypothetical protein